MISKRTWGLLALVTLDLAAAEVPRPPVIEAAKGQWNTEELFRVPRSFPCPQPLKHLESDYWGGSVRGVLLESLPFRGRPTRVFAWYGIPGRATRENPVPAMVLVHGASGTARNDWVTAWTKRGYAAIAMDTSGYLPIMDQNSTDRYQPWTRNPDGGPQGWDDFKQIDRPLTDQWTSHAVAAVIKSHSFLRAQRGVDPSRIGLTGISWGGYLNCIVSGLDHRFRFAAPVYGCGFFAEGSHWQDGLLAMGEQGKRWEELWDGGRYTSFARVPMLFCTGTNDHYYHLPCWQKTYRSVRRPVTLSLKIGMPHEGFPVGDPPEIAAFANHHFKGEAPLARILKQGKEDRQTWVEYQCTVPVTKAELCYTRDMSPSWNERKWESLPATLNFDAKRAEAALPQGVFAYYFNLVDERDLIVSSEHQDLSKEIVSSERRDLFKKTLFRDDFNTGRADAWALEDGWAVKRDGDNFVLSGSGNTMIRLKAGGNWTDYGLRLRLKILRNGVNLWCRSSDAGGYAISFGVPGVTLGKQDRRAGVFHTLANQAGRCELGKWHDVEIRVVGANIKCYLDGNLRLDHTDESPLKQGTIALQTPFKDCHVQIDDVEVFGKTR